jgi:hypothetical protein
MTHKNFSFWLCTLLSGVVIGIASQRIPEAGTHSKIFKSHSNSFYCTSESPLSSQPISSLQMHKAGYDTCHHKASRLCETSVKLKTSQLPGQPSNLPEHK